jgi:hypothetical protein
VPRLERKIMTLQVAHLTPRIGSEIKTDANDLDTLLREGNTWQVD